LIRKVLPHDNDGRIKVPLPVCVGPNLVRVQASLLVYGGFHKTRTAIACLSARHQSSIPLALPRHHEISGPRIPSASPRASGAREDVSDSSRLYFYQEFLRRRAALREANKAARNNPSAKHPPAATRI